MKLSLLKRINPLIGLLASIVGGVVIALLLGLLFFKVVVPQHLPTLTNENAGELIGCRLSLHSASGVTNELGRAEKFTEGADGPNVYVEWGWFDALGHPLTARADDKITPAWVPATAITGYTCDGGKSWTRFSK